MNISHSAPLQRTIRIESRTGYCATLLGLFLFLGIGGTTQSFAEEKWGEELPKVTLKTQDGKTVRFYEDLVKGKTVIINFMYTKCKTLCEAGTMNLLQVQKALGADLGRNVFIYSISLDSEHDTPAVLKAYSESHGVKPGWTFLTGNPKDIAALQDKLGLAGLSPELRQKLGLPIKAANADAVRRQHSGMILIANEPYNRRERLKILSRPDIILQTLEGMKPPQSIPKNLATLVRTSKMLTASEAIEADTGAAAEKVIEAKTTDNGVAWQPNNISASVGDVVEWKLGAGTHGVRITNWAAVKDHVEVETVGGQQPFNQTTGRNDNSTSTAGQVLLRLKIKSVPPAPAEITFNCIVHGNIMRGKVSATTASLTPAAKPIEANAGAATEKAIEAKTVGNDRFWQPNDITASMGDVIEWKFGSGPESHGVRITNWAAVKDHVEVETVPGQQPFNATTGRNNSPTTTPGQVLLRLKIKSVPPAPVEITFNCIVHGRTMSGKVSLAASVTPAAKAIEANAGSAAEKVIEGKTTDNGVAWQPNSISAAVGDVVEWKLGVGTHGVRITNWAAVKDHVEVETVAGQQPFNATTGRNDNPTSTAGQVLLRLKITSVPPAPAEITFNCIKHGRIMRGKVSVAAASAGASEQR